MRPLVLLFLGALAVLSTLQATAQEDGDLQEQFRQWAVQHSKDYLDRPQEFAHRFSVWAENVARISRHAAANANSKMRLGLNALSDLTPAEFRTRYLGAPMAARQWQHQQPGNGLLRRFGWLAGKEGVESRGSKGAVAGKHDKAQHWRYENVTAPPAVDWRQHQPPVLGAIKDQHVNGTPCGSCWAFSAVSIMEIASAMGTGRVVLGSEQQLIDCDRKYDHGCAGGGWLNAIQYTIKHKGLATEADYPYTGKDGHCRKKLAYNTKHELRVHSWEDVAFSNETALAQAVSQTPVIVAICAGPALDAWHQYKGGIFDAPCCEKEEEITLDHGIVVVGYGTDSSGTDYWILKNSWGTTWGENGFMRIQRNHGKHGKCALASYPAMVFRKPLPREYAAAQPVVLSRGADAAHGAPEVAAS